jgi:hypothetical protein
MRRIAGAGIAAWALVLAGAIALQASAHGIGGSDATFVAEQRGPAIFPFMYLGAKHMVTGYDHLLFLAGVLFWLRRLRDVAVYVTLFALGHSLTLMGGVLLDVSLDEHLVDAAIGFSVAWKAFDNLGGSKLLLGWQPDNRLPVFGFGLVHGFGLATKLQALGLHREGLVANLVAFNVGVEIGQALALAGFIAVITVLRGQHGAWRVAVPANAALMLAGFLLTGLQLSRFLFER